MLRRILRIGLLTMAACRPQPADPEPFVEPSPAADDRSAAAVASNAPAPLDLCRGAFEARMSALAERCTDAERSTALLREQVRSWSNSSDDCRRMTTTPAGRVSLAAPGLAACTKALGDAVRRNPNHAGALSDEPACLGLLIGAQPLGAACRSDVECLSGLHCHGEGPDADGACAAAADVGSACDGFDSPAVFGLHRPCVASAVCDGTRCRARVGASEPCARREACIDGMSCIGGHCASSSLGHAGAACGLDPRDCGPGFYCARAAGSTDGHCAEQRTAGAACENDAECEGRCSVGTGRDSERFGVEIGTCIPVCSRR